MRNYLSFFGTGLKVDELKIQQEGVSNVPFLSLKNGIAFQSAHAYFSKILLKHCRLHSLLEKRHSNQDKSHGYWLGLSEILENYEKLNTKEKKNALIISHLIFLDGAKLKTTFRIGSGMDMVATAIAELPRYHR